MYLGVAGYKNKKKCIILSADLVYLNKQCTCSSIVRHFIWVITVCKSTCLAVSWMQRVNSRLETALYVARFFDGVKNSPEDNVWWESFSKNNCSMIEWLLGVNVRYMDLSIKSPPIGSVTLWFPEVCSNFDSLTTIGDFVEHGKKTDNSNV